MWAVFYLSDESGNFKRSLVNLQVRKTQTITETVQARLPDLTNVAGEFDGSSLWHNLANENPGKLIISVGVANRKPFKIRRTCILRLCVLCVGSNNAIAKPGMGDKTL